MAQRGYQEKMQLLKNKLTVQEYQLFEEVVIRRYDIHCIAQSENVSVNALYIRWHRLRKKIQGFL